MDNEDRWEALAALLLRQRVVVLKERSRAAFARRVGVSDSVLSHLESAHRDNYDAATLLSLEKWYGLTQEQLRDVLGDLYPGAPVTTEHSVATITSAPGSAVDVEHLERSINDIRAMLDVMADQLDEYHRNR
jgi:transcriptional regulator with XRE-family HTH domain